MRASFPIPILFAHYGDNWIRGSEVILLDLMRSLNPKLFQPIVWCNGALLEERSRAAGFTTYRSDFITALDYGSEGGLLSFWALVKECKFLCRRHNIRILHANSAAPTQWLALAACQLRLPLVTHLHIDYLKRSRYALLLHAATLAVGVSKHVLLGLASDGMPSSQLQVIYNGIDFNRLGAASTDIRRELGIPSEAFIILSAGSLIERKGFDVLIKAFSHLIAGSEPPHLIIMGDGPNRNALERLAARLNVAETVHFVGHVESTADFYIGSNVFALASRADSFGLVLAEAGYFGLASVATSVGGIPEVVAHGETGFLVEADNVGQFGEALELLRRDGTLRARMGTAAARRVQDKFSIERMVEEFQQLYLSLASLESSSFGWAAFGRAVARPYARILLTIRNRSDTQR